MTWTALWLMTIGLINWQFKVDTFLPIQSQGGFHIESKNAMAGTFQKTTTRLVGSVIFGAIFTAFGQLLAQAEVHQFQGPHFRKGLWHFERTLYAIPRSSEQPLMKKEMTRCVDPTIAMKGTFASPDVGNCHSAIPHLLGNRYVFPMRCDYMGPVMTEITVENDSAYTEINAITVGNFPREDKVVARRIGDCDKLEVEFTPKNEHSAAR